MFSRAYNLRLNDSSEEILCLFKENTKNAFSLDFEILSDVIKGPMHENPQRVSSVVRVDVSGPYLQGVQRRYNPGVCKISFKLCGGF